MGYNTDFSGELKFTSEPTAPQLAALNSIFGEDCRDHPEWGASNLYWVDLELNEDFTGIRWNRSEKTYHMDKLVNLVLRVMREKWPSFGLTGTLKAQGEDFDDRWFLTIGEDGLAHVTKDPPLGEHIKCPHCGKRFTTDDSIGVTT